MGKNAELVAAKFGQIWGCRDGSVVKSSYLSRRVPKFGFQHPLQWLTAISNSDSNLGCPILDSWGTIPIFTYRHTYKNNF